MSTKKLVAIVALTVLMTAGTTTWGQRGVGDNEGVVRQAIETQRTAIEGTVKEIIIELENKLGKTIPIEDISKEAAERGISDADVDEVVEKLKRSGDLFEPRRGFVSRI